ncbi:MAG: SOS response-associated peptidase [bacterium]|nr:SOS response-associated peptidase [bacterium]
MCGRYVLHADPQQLQQAFNLTTAPEFAPRFNIAPTQTVPVITSDHPDQAEFLRWGLIPSWAKDMSMGAKLINARSETVEEKPSFRNAFKRRRCVIPMNGFYEWKQLDDGSKQPIYIHHKEEPFWGLAGLWEVWKNPDTGEEVRTFSILTTSANAFMQQIHDRMPVILQPKDYERWLTTGEKDAPGLRDLMVPFDAALMTGYEVSKAVNKAAVDLPNLILPLQ